MTCRELAELLCDYVAGELDAELQETVRRHLEECGTCVHFVESYQLTIHISRRLPPAEMPPHLLERIRAALEAEQNNISG